MEHTPLSPHREKPLASASAQKEADAPSDPVSDSSRPATPGLRRVVAEKLRGVIDPELGVNIVDLGLLYQILLEEDGTVKVHYTTTTPGCPMRRYLTQQIEKTLSALPGINGYEAVMVMDPPWQVEMIAPDVDFFSVPPPRLSF